VKFSFSLSELISLLTCVVSLIYFVVRVEGNQKTLTQKIDSFKDLVNHKIEELGKKQDKHNCLIERVAVLEHSGRDRASETNEIFQRLRKGNL